MTTPTEQRGARASFTPLVLISAAFFIPSYRACSGDFESPAQYATGDALSFLWIAPVFLAAMLMAALTVRVLARGEVERGVRRAALAALAVLVLNNVAVGVGFMSELPRDWPWLAAGLVSVAAAVWWVRRARGRGPWEIWNHLTTAFAWVFAGAGPTLILAADVPDGFMHHVGPGGYVYLGAVALLLVTSTWRALTE